MINWDLWYNEKRTANDRIKRELQPAKEVPPFKMTKRAAATPDYPVSTSKRWAHWSASMYPAHNNYEWHLMWMKRAKIGGVKFLSDGNGNVGSGDSGLGFGISVRDHGMVPCVRYYMPADHRWTDANDYATEAYVRAGIYLIETINEPDLGYEWSDGHLPDDWAERSFANWITMAERILALGGIPVSPSMASGFMQARGDNAGQLLFNPFMAVRDAGIKVFVCGIHNYALDHPIDYPYDPVNQEGQPLTVEEYHAAGGDWAWDKPYGRSVEDQIAEINGWRASDKNPGDGIYDDDACFLAVEIFYDMLREAGFDNVPVLTTEGGPCLTDRQDRRYPRISPVTMEAVIDGELDYMADDPLYMGYAWWLWGNPSIGGTGGWQTNQWFWPVGDFSDSDGFIPIVRHLIDKPIEEGGQPPIPSGQPPSGEPMPEPDLILEPENVLEKYGLVLKVVDDTPVGADYYKIVHIKHYPVGENGGDYGRHNLYMDVLDKDGQRVYGAVVAVKNSDLPVSQAVVDKPANEPGTNVPMEKNDTLTVWLDGTWTTLQSDVIGNIHTRHPDEGFDVHWGHHSFLVVWQLTEKEGDSLPPEPSPTPPPDVPPTKEEIREMAWKEIEIPYSPTFALQSYAAGHNLGMPASGEFDWQGYRFQLYVMGIVYAPIDEWGKTTHVTW